jgi:hypothetical protein
MPDKRRKEAVTNPVQSRIESKNSYILLDTEYKGGYLVFEIPSSLLIAKLHLISSVTIDLAGILT